MIASKNNPQSRRSRLATIIGIAFGIAVIWFGFGQIVVEFWKAAHT